MYSSGAIAVTVAGMEASNGNMTVGFDSARVAVGSGMAGTVTTSGRIRFAGPAGGACTIWLQGHA